MARSKATGTGTQAVDAYIAGAPAAAQPMLKELRRAIIAAAPKAQEKMSYGMPFYEYHGRLLYFAGYKTHVGLYAVGASDPHAKGLEKYMAAKASLRFPLDQALPVELIRKLVASRADEHEAKAKKEAQA
jgi:uncharacterized protein YdhG (YjbR/CyaY superfamily)